MILYDKNTKFIGVSADILAVLGYEDMNAFMAYNNDVADLFVNKQGYVHKFDDFSWINYVLNGSLPSKNVIIKQRSGGEIGASISITEILLSNAKDDKCYLVSLSDIHYIDIKSDENTDKNKQPIFKIKNEEPVTAKVDFNNLAQNDGGAKVTFIMDEEQDMSASFAAANFNDNRTEYQEKKFFADETLNQNETKKERETISVKIDIQEVSDILGISRDDVIRYMKEYASYLEDNVKSLHALYENKESAKIKGILANLIGIGSNLRIKELIQSFQKLLSVDANTDKSETLKELEEIASEFKQSALKL